MRIKILLIFLLFIGISATAQPPIKQIDYYTSWTPRGARVLPLNELNLSLTSVSRYGNYRDTEINSLLLLMPFVPNIGLKHLWQDSNFIIASQHTIYYPTPGLKWMQRNGFNDQIPKKYDIPHIFTFRNELIVSYILDAGKPCTDKTPDFILTGRLGFDASLKSDKVNFPIIETPFLYQRTASYYNNVVYFIGVELAGNIRENYNFAINADFYDVNFTDIFAVEGQGKVFWNIDDTFTLSGGYKFYYLTTDYYREICITPTIDFTIKIGNKKRLQQGLWEPIQ